MDLPLLMHALADWIAKLASTVSIKIDICIICSASLIKQTVIVDFFVHSSGPFVH